MAKKTIAQLKREIDSLKKKNKVKAVKLNKAANAAREQKELEKELKELKKSPGFKKLKSLSKKKLTKEQLRMHGKSTAKAGKTLWNTLGKVVNKLDKINV